MKRRQRTPRSKARFDLDEVRPGLFVIGNPDVTQLLRDEGEVTGTFFRITTWRRDGLMARLQQRGFTTRTIEERLEALPRPATTPTPLGALLLRNIAGERGAYSILDADTLRWQELSPQQQGEAQVIALRQELVVRRRRGRGDASYYRVVEVAGQAELQPMIEDKAVMLAFAQAAADGPPTLLAHRRDTGYLLPKTNTLPADYRSFLGLLGEPTADGLLIPKEHWPLAKRAYERLGLRPLVARQG